MNAEAWKCHAKPASLSGSTCGFVNQDGGRPRGELVFCRGCGCSKKASDDRLARKEAKKLRVTTDSNTGYPSTTFTIKPRSS